MKPYYFPNSGYVDVIFGGQSPVCMDRAEVDRLSREDGGWENIWEQAHEASDDEISEYGVYNTTPAQISIDNGATYTTPSMALEEVSLDTMANYMDDSTREAVHAELAPCSDIEFLKRYLEIAPDDLIIG